MVKVVFNVAVVAFLLGLAIVLLGFVRREDGVTVDILGRQSGRATVASRLREFGPAARARLLPFFEAAGVSYPPRAAALVGFKHEKRLDLLAGPGPERLAFVRSYPILAASGRLGPKLRQGDKQVPEGLYRIESLNPNSRFHLALRVDYPNAFDQRQAARDRRSDLGGDIMIHGGAASIGCLAMGDEAAEDLFVLVAEVGKENVEVLLSPVDFREQPLPAVAGDLQDWTPELHSRIRARLEELPPARG